MTECLIHFLLCRKLGSNFGPTKFDSYCSLHALACRQYGRVWFCLFKWNLNQARQIIRL